MLLSRIALLIKKKKKSVCQSMLYLASCDIYFSSQGHMQEICLSAKQGKEVLKVPPEVP